MKRTLFGWVIAAVGMTFFFQGPSTVEAQVAPSLGTAASYALLGTNSIPTVGTATCTTSLVEGDVGSTFTSITNTGCTIINGAVVAPVPASVVTDFDAAYTALDTANPICTGPIPTVDTILPPGVYCSPAGIALNSITLTLSGAPGSVWVFKVGTGGLGALAATSLTMQMAGGAQRCNSVYWRTAEAATVTTSSFLGTVLAGTAVTVTGPGTFLGRAQAGTDVTVTDVEIGGCAGGNGPVTAIPALGPAAMAGLIALLAGAGLLVLRKL